MQRPLASLCVERLFPFRPAEGKASYLLSAEEDLVGPTKSNKWHVAKLFTQT